VDADGLTVGVDHQSISAIISIEFKTSPTVA
jgi:hypothetical protein